MEHRLHFPRVLDLLLKEDNLAEARFMIPFMERAQRYVFESYGDTDDAVSKAVHYTSEEMIDAGMFHLPFPVIWIEDPWSVEQMAAAWENAGVASEAARAIRAGALTQADIKGASHLHLCIEEFQRITMWSVTTLPIRDPYTGKISIQYQFHGIPREIDLSPDRKPETDWLKWKGENVHCMKQLLVTLATKQAHTTKHEGHPWKKKQPIKTRQYDFTTVEIRVAGQTQAEAMSQTGRRRKLELVSGYIWGKHTRPKDDQRWIAPYWRGDEALGVVLRDHYEVKP